MASIDGFRLLGIKPGDGELYDLGWVQIDRSNLPDEARREKALKLLQGFATGRTFTDNELATDLRYVWGHTYDSSTGEEIRFEIPPAVNHPEGPVMLQHAPVDELVDQFLEDATRSLSLPV